MQKKIDINIGDRFGKLIVKEEKGAKRNAKGKHQGLVYLCVCDCGKETEVISQNLKTGNTTSCGCNANYEEFSEKMRQALNDEFSIDGVKVPFLTRNSKVGKSGVKGITVDYNRKGEEVFVVRIRVKGASYYGGRFSNLEEAIKERKVLEERYHQPYIEELENRIKKDQDGN